MTGDPTALVALASCGVVATSIASAAVLKGWTAWLDLKRLEMGSAGGGSSRPAPHSPIEVAALKERVRRLEAIASGVGH